MSIVKRNNVRVLGEGVKPMLLAHGYGCDQQMWRLITPAFIDDYRVVLFDHVGAGGSDLNAYDRMKYSSLRGYAHDILELCDALDLWDIIFVGHSVSAMIGLLAAIEQPARFDRLVLIGPSPCYINTDDYVGGFTRQDIEALLELQDSNYLGWSAGLAPVIMGNPNRPELAEELRESFCRTDPEIARQFAAVTFLSDNRADLPASTVPALILQSREDAIAPMAVGAYVHRHLAHSELVMLDAMGHCPHISAPAATIDAIKTYLER